MSAPTLFISDLHLDASRPDITEQFLRFLRGEARTAKALYILGDLFETWIGDDDPDADKKDIQAALRELTRSGVPCFIMHGNRDFLIGGRFCKNTGCKLIADGKAITVYDRRIVVMHGDTLCTDDRDYQRLRRIVRNPLVKLVFRCMSLRQRQNLAAKIRAGSKAHIESSMERIMDVNDAAVAKAFDKHRVDLIIHGHTHRPFVHSLRVNSKPVTRIVLGDWYSQGSVLRWNEQGYELSSLRRSDLDR